ncbi:MAG TPA: hypothetical protein VHH73_12155, partial [Verrucomicrobiae bacterium]|nr:hypothetical protein [Verrucomicrobiae bacterium]
MNFCGAFPSRAWPVCWLLCIHLIARGAQSDDRWWPVQAMPRALVEAGISPKPSESRLALEMLVQSVAGLAAKAVNEARGEEMVWVAMSGGDVEEWHRRLVAARPEMKSQATLGAWELVERFARRGVIKGYILYRLDPSAGHLNDHRAGMDCSVNVATSLAGLLDGVIVDESLEAGAKARGLPLLLDARGKSQAWCFETYQERFNRRLLCTQDPKKPHTRDLAIAQKAFTVFGKDEPTTAAMKWLDPLSPILGWNGGDEFESTDLSTGLGHIQTATDWCMNLPVLMAGADRQPPAPVKRF